MKHEVCMYAMVISDGGDSEPANGKTPDGWNVYVREYAHEDADSWEEVYDKDFNTEEEASREAERLAMKYRCGVDCY